MRRQRLEAILHQTDDAENAAIVLHHCLRDHENPNRRTNLLERARKACTNSGPVYRPAFERWRQEISRHAATQEVNASGRFVTGLGIASVLETGIRLHPVYGTPLIPGSGLKGLAAHFAHSVWGEKDPEFQERGGHYQAIFGAKANAGLFHFHDAWILPESLSAQNEGLVADVMTPHHNKYKLNAAQAPTDFDSPIPVPFLSVTGRFLMAIEPGAADPGDLWTNLVLDLVLEALKTWGGGAKTRTGYGRFDAHGARMMPQL